MDHYKTLAAIRRHDTPQATLRMIASWAENAADCFDEVDSEYDPGSERAVAMRKRAAECCAVIFLAIMRGQPEACFRLARGLDIAQRVDSAQESG